MDKEKLTDLISKASEARDQFDRAVRAIEEHIGVDLDEIDLTSDDVCDYDADGLIAIVGGTYA